MRRPANPTHSDSAHGGPPEDPSFATTCPTLFAFLTDTIWDDGSERQTSTVLLMAEGCLWKAWCNDRALGRSLWVSGSTLHGLLQALDGALGDPGAGWRVNPSMGGVKKKRN